MLRWSSKRQGAGGVQLQGVPPELHAAAGRFHCGVAGAFRGEDGVGVGAGLQGLQDAHHVHLLALLEKMFFHGFG